MRALEVLVCTLKRASKHAQALGAAFAAVMVQQEVNVLRHTGPVKDGVIVSDYALLASNITACSVRRLLEGSVHERVMQRIAQGHDVVEDSRLLGVGEQFTKDLDCTTEQGKQACRVRMQG